MPTATLQRPRLRPRLCLHPCLSLAVLATAPALAQAPPPASDEDPWRVVQLAPNRMGMLRATGWVGGENRWTLIRPDGAAAAPSFPRWPEP